MWFEGSAEAECYKWEKTFSESILWETVFHVSDGIILAIDRMANDYAAGLLFTLDAGLRLVVPRATWE